jgi:hypothetical protein
MIRKTREDTMWGKRRMWNFATVIGISCAGDKIEKNEMGRACGTYGGGEGGV